MVNSCTFRTGVGMEAIEGLRFLASLPLAGTGRTEGGEKTQPFYRFHSRLFTQFSVAACLPKLSKFLVTFVTETKLDPLIWSAFNYSRRTSVPAFGEPHKLFPRRLEAVLHLRPRSFARSLARSSRFLP